jgi:hypothetical protein
MYGVRVVKKVKVKVTLEHGHNGPEGEEYV